MRKKTIVITILFSFIFSIGIVSVGNILNKKEQSISQVVETAKYQAEEKKLLSINDEDSEDGDIDDEDNGNEEGEIIAEWDISATGEENEVFAYLLEDGTLIITGEGRMKDWTTSDGQEWNDKKMEITSIILDEGVKNIGECAFWGCENVTEVAISRTVETISEDVFTYCRTLTNIEVDEDNEYYKSIEGVLFDKKATEILCYPEGKKATTYEIPDTVRYIGTSAFIECKSLESITIPNTVVEIKNEAFWGCSKLTEIEIPNSVTSIGNSAFNDCAGLTKVKISNSVKSVKNGTFFHCVNLVQVMIPEGVTNIENYAFVGCSRLRWIRIPDSVTNIEDNAFEDWCEDFTIYCHENSVAKEYAETKKINYEIIDNVAPEIISITGNPETWTKGKVTLTVIARDEQPGLADEAYSFDGGKTWQVSNQKTYTDNTKGIQIKVRDKVGNISQSEEINITKIIKIDRIAVKVNPNKTSYHVGDTLDTTGLQIEVIYDNEITREVIKSGFTCEPKLLTAGTNKITVTYQGKTTTFAITVKERIEENEDQDQVEEPDEDTDETDEWEEIEDWIETDELEEDAMEDWDEIDDFDEIEEELSNKEVTSKSYDFEKEAKAETSLPKTGHSIVIFILLTIAITVTCILYVKYKEYKQI